MRESVRVSEHMTPRGIAVFSFVAVLIVALAGGLRDGVRAETAKPQAVAAASPTAKPARKVDFNRDIRPILSDNCYRCHGPDKGHRKADLRLDIKEGLFSAKDDAFPVVPGKPDDSVLFMRITSDDADLRMPHKDSNKHLDDKQIALIKQWIEEGAEWKGHWSYIPPAKPTTMPAEKIDGFTR